MKEESEKFHFSIEDWMEYYRDKALTCSELRKKLEDLRAEEKERSNQCRAIKRLLAEYEEEISADFF